MVIPLVEGRDVVAEVDVPLVMSGRAGFVNLGDDVDDALIFNVRLCLRSCKSLQGCLGLFSSIQHLAGSLLDALVLFAFLLDRGGCR